MVVCDVCSAPMNFEDGYALTTTQVVTTTKYWNYIISRFNLDEQLLNMYVPLQAMQRKGWLVCESCSNMFSFDRKLAREYAKSQKDPPGSGSADVQRTAAFAASAWRELHGTWPSWVR